MRKLQQKERRGFDMLFTLIAWLIWKEHNGRLFDRKSHSVIEVFELIKQVTTLLALLHVARASMWITPICNIVVTLKYLMHMHEMIGRPINTTGKELIHIFSGLLLHPSKKITTF